MISMEKWQVCLSSVVRVFFWIGSFLISAALEEEENHHIWFKISIGYWVHLPQTLLFSGKKKIILDPLGLSAIRVNSPVAG